MEIQILIPGSESRDGNSDSHPGIRIPGLKFGSASRDFNPGMKNRPGFPSRPGADPCLHHIIDPHGDSPLRLAESEHKATITPMSITRYAPIFVYFCQSLVPYN